MAGEELQNWEPENRGWDSQWFGGSPLDGSKVTWQNTSNIMFIFDQIKHHYRSSKITIHLSYARVFSFDTWKWLKNDVKTELTSIQPNISLLSSA